MFDTESFLAAEGIVAWSRRGEWRYPQEEQLGVQDDLANGSEFRNEIVHSFLLINL